MQISAQYLTTPRNALVQFPHPAQDILPALAAHHFSARHCSYTMPRRRPTLLWADRLDKLFITVLLPQLQGPAVLLLPSGSLQLNATSEAAALVIDLQLHSEVVPGESEWFAREQKLELTVAKAVRGRWAQLLQAGHEYAGELRTDWQKYLDHDDELDELEQKSGQRGPPVQGSPGFSRAVDDYWRRQRVEICGSPRKRRHRKYSAKYTHTSTALAVAFHIH